MKFKRTKYNIIFLLMFILIMGVFSFEIFSVATTPETTIPSLPGEASGGENEEKEPQENLDDDLPTDEQQNADEEDLDEIDTDMPSERFPQQIIDHVLTKLYSGVGYKSTYDKTMTNIAMGMEVTQRIKGTIDKSGDKSLEILKFQAGGSMASMGQNMVRGFYIEGDSVTKYQTDSPSKNIDSSAQQETMTKKEFLSKYALNLADRPVLDFKQNNFVITPQTMTDASKREYYKITATLSNLNYLEKTGYSKYYETTGDLTNVKTVSAVFEFYCYKNTGIIFQITSREKYTGTNPQFGVSVSVEVLLTQKFSKVNQEIEINKP